MSIMELGALGEFLGVFALVATLIYLSVQVRHARNESANAVIQARTTGTRELSMGIATSDGLSAALTKALRGYRNAEGIRPRGREPADGCSNPCPTRRGARCFAGDSSIS